jgi:hypothetical protein
LVRNLLTHESFWYQLNPIIIDRATMQREADDDVMFSEALQELPRGDLTSLTAGLGVLRRRLGFAARKSVTVGVKSIGVRKMPFERSCLSTADVLDRILDKGIVIDYEARVSLVGIDIMTTVEARVVVASIATYLDRAPAIAGTGRLIGGLGAFVSRDRTGH